jgi:hypothetical protein
VAYPKVVPLERLGLPVHGPFGDQVTPRTLWEDPTCLAGVRPYLRGDPTLDPSDAEVAAAADALATIQRTVESEGEGPVPDSAAALPGVYGSGHRSARRGLASLDADVLVLAARGMRRPER